jgi:hypothetical protein
MSNIDELLSYVADDGTAWRDAKAEVVVKQGEADAAKAALASAQTAIANASLGFDKAVAEFKAAVS